MTQIIIWPKLCECGCGERVTKAHNRFVLGHNTRVRDPAWPLEARQKLSLAHKGKFLSEEHKEKLAKAHIGKYHTAETKLKMSITRRGRTCAAETKAKIGMANRGKRRTEEAKIKMVAAQQGHKHTRETKHKMSLARQGTKHWNWQGGLSFELYEPKFNGALKRYIRKRDNFICQGCGRPESDFQRVLNVHHIDYNKKNNDLQNLISLCECCNSKVNFNRLYWTAFFQQLVQSAKDEEIAQQRDSKRSKKAGTPPL